MSAKSGPVLIIPPAGLIGTWIKEFEASIDETNKWVDMTMLVGHSQSGNGREVSKEAPALMEKWSSNSYVRPRQNQTRLLVVTSSRSYSTHVLRELQERTDDPRRPRNLSYWGMVLRDEVHIEKAPLSSAMTSSKVFICSYL